MRLTWFQIARLTVPVIKEAVVELYQSKMLASDGGSKITAEEWQAFARDVSVQVGETVFREIVRRKDFIDAE